MARILFAGDTQGVVDSVVVDLAREGHDVLRETDGAGAISSLTREPVDLLVSDFEMHYLDGIHLAKLANDTPPRTPVILLVSGEWTRAHQDRAWHAKINSVLLKSDLDGKSLSGEVHRLLKRESVNREKSVHQ